MNIIELFEQQVQKKPNSKAITDAKSLNSLSFKNLHIRSLSIATILQNDGIKRNDHVLIFIPPSLELMSCLFALLKIGAVAIFIDPGVGKKQLLNCIKICKPSAMIGVKSIHLLRMIYRTCFSTIKKNYSFSKYNLPGIKNLTPSTPARKFTHDINSNDNAAIVFTSGGTGNPKGVVYTHKMFCTQINLLQKEFALNSEDIDYSCFPLFSFLIVTMGITTIIPNMDPRKPANCNPQKITNDLIFHNISFASGSPAIWERIANYCQYNSITFPKLRSILMFGAPVNPSLLKKLTPLVPNGDIFTPYGATESLPICNISAKEILSSTANKTDTGAGTCIGKPLEEKNVKIIKQTTAAINNFSELTLLADYQIGEIIVTGEQVTQKYLNNQHANLISKIKKENKIWHRLGDVGYFDSLGRIWFCGRSSHVIKINKQLIYPIKIESIFNNNSMIKRSALIKIITSNKSHLTLIIERYDKSKRLYFNKKTNFISQLLKINSCLKKENQITKFFLSKKLPLDRRHNIKIDRIKLSQTYNENNFGELCNLETQKKF
jgi:olefin beta-lactone synthetase